MSSRTPVGSTSIRASWRVTTASRATPTRPRTWLSSAGFNRAVDDPASGYTAADLAEHIRTEFSTFRWLFEPILAAAGFEILSAEFRGSVYGTYTCRKLRPS
jgi:hypothetical protein